MNKKILVADDSENTRKLLTFALEKEGYKIIQAKDGEEALEKIRNIHPDLAIIDIVMPKLDGFSAVLQMKKNKKTKEIPIIITGKEKLKVLFTLYETAKFEDFMEKPFRPRNW